MEKESRPEKGKGKERATEEPCDEPSFAARIASSVAGLAGDFTRRPDGADAIATAFNSSGKLQGPSTASSTWHENLPVRGADWVRDGNSGHLQRSGELESFRTVSSHSGAAAEFDQFSNARGTGLIGPPWTLNTGDLPLHASGEIFGRGALPASQDASNYLVDDGAEVRMLLSDPTFSPDSEDFMNMEPEFSANDLFPKDFSAEEQGAADWMLSTLPAPPVHQPVPENHPLNLNPLLVQDEILELESSLANDGASYMSFSSSQQREHLLSEWEDVLNSYTDSVWGDMLPVVQAARSQIQEVKAGTIQCFDTKAVSRLKMIVGHLRDTTRLPTPLTEHILTQSHVQRNGPQQEEQQGNKKREVPTFHCPWISCHERFYNALELRLHSSTHTFYTCPHLGCGQHFRETELEGWDKHVQVPHHDLLGSEGGARKEIETI